MLFSKLLAFAFASLLTQCFCQTQSNPSNVDYTCSSTKPCKIGCCSTTGICGMGPTFCGAGNCTSSCDAKSECDAGWGAQWSAAEKCPLNVCCSKFGFCGTTAEFCGSSQVTKPSCPGGTSSNQRVIAYYEGWSTTRACGGMFPEDLPFSLYTHLNFAFALVDPNTFAIAPMSPGDPDLMQRLTGLKQINPGLQVWLSIGGWSMNDPDQPTAATFSQLAGSTSAQNAFFASLIQIMQNYGFDGVDIDWEYPVAPERSGAPADHANYVSFLANLRSALGSSGHAYGLSITLPSSYWYLRNFDIVSIEPIIDWFNVMTYDIHGTWDSSDPFIGPFVYAHTNLTEIDQAMDLLWRNNISPSKVTLGLGFYGRSFTLSDPSCTAPGCGFSAGGDPGKCTASAGTLSFSEIQDVIATENPVVTLDSAAAVKIVVWNGNQWVSYDDEETLKMKVDYANNLCLGGVMIWAGSLDNANADAATALSNVNGRANMNKNLLSSLQNSLTQCVWGDCGSGGASCPPGTSPAQRSDGGGKGNTGIYTGCPRGQQRNFCCPNNNIPTCQWRGTASLCQHAACLTGEVAIASDICGTGKCCNFHHKNLCCTQTDTDFAFSQCQWAGSAPVCSLIGGNRGQASCPSGLTALTEDKDGAGGEQPCFADGGYKTFCCPSPAPFTNCAWYNDTSKYDYWPRLTSIFSGSEPINSWCSGGCPNGQTPIAADSTACRGGTTAYFCCDNPTALSNPIPVPDTNLCDLPSGIIDESGISEPENPGNSLTELELFEQEGDCYVGGVADSGDPNVPFYQNEVKRRAEAGEATEEDINQLLSDLWTEYSKDLVKRGAARSSKICRNRPGNTRGAIVSALRSTSYRDVSWLITNAAKKVYYADKRACAQKLLNVGPNLVTGYKFVAEHVWEQQGEKDFFQAMIDGVKPGNSPLSTGSLSWTPFDKTNMATAYFFKTWSSMGITFSQAGSTPMESFYSVLGTLTDSSNLLVLDSQTNGIKAIIWQGGKNLIASDKWKNASHLQRLALLNRIKSAFDYMNSADAQASFQYVYTKTLVVCGSFQQVLSAAGINYDVTNAFKEWTAAQFAYMGTNAQSWLANSAGLSAEVAYWASGLAVSQYSAQNAKANLLSVQTLISSMPQWATIKPPT